MRTNDNGTSADKRAIQRNREPARPWAASGRARRTTPDDVTRHALSYVWNLAPIIHPLPQPPPAAIVYQRASVEVTLSFRENSPHSRRPQKTRNRVAIVGRQACFRNAADKPTRQRYENTKLRPRLKSLLTLLELIGAGPHDEKIRGAWADMTTSETGSVAWPGQLPRGGCTVSVLVGTAIVVADMVGVGGFTSLGFQGKDIPSGLSILLVWALRGIVAVCGVLSYREL